MYSHRELANAIRALSMDAVQRANSGHPGMPMGMADIAEVLWNDFLKHNPKNPTWPNRDRFILSNGHGSMLQYALLHLTGYDVSMDELKNFRQLHSKTPGHPEFGPTPGVETTTGPLGQGLANAVGMALAEKMLAAQFNRPDFELIDHHTYTFLGDGCMMEGISHEVCSLAGTLGLGKLIAFWDDNEISIDGDVKGWFTTDTPKRFEAYGWHVVRDVDGHDAAAVTKAIEKARNETTRPSLICCKTVIGFGAPTLAGTEACHGAALGEDEIKAARAQLNWTHAPFHIPKDMMAQWDATERGIDNENTWQTRFAAYKTAHPKEAGELERRLAGEFPNEWQHTCETFINTLQDAKKDAATRKSSQQCLETFGAALPELFGGSADLTGSNGTAWSQSKRLSRNDFSGNYLHYGVREFGMFAIMNGVSLHGGFIPYGGTFLTFVDYGRNAVRLAALNRQRTIFVLTHDSIALGEDGPTHQPIEHIGMLRLTPHVDVWRPADTIETAAAWKTAIERQDGPSCLLLTRQTVPFLQRSDDTLQQVARGGYLLFEPNDPPSALIIATGSETQLALGAAEILSKKGMPTRVVSMPCVEVFLRQDEAYQQHVLPDDIETRVAIEAGSPDTWYRFVGRKGKVIGIDQFGASAPAADLFKAFGFTIKKITDDVRALIASHAITTD